MPITTTTAVILPTTLQLMTTANSSRAPSVAQDLHNINNNYNTLKLKSMVPTGIEPMANPCYITTIIIIIIPMDIVLII